MMKILGRNNSVNVIKVLWCATELGLEFERTDVGGAFGGTLGGALGGLGCCLGWCLGWC